MSDSVYAVVESLQIHWKTTVFIFGMHAGREACGMQYVLPLASGTGYEFRDELFSDKPEELCSKFVLASHRGPTLHFNEDMIQVPTAGSWDPG